MPRKTRIGERLSVRVSGASMRPRPDAAENPHLISMAQTSMKGFNEAAARCRGKLAGAYPSLATKRGLQ